MDPIDILEKVNTFYSNAFSQLITITALIIGFGGIILPLILQLIQNKSLQNEKKSLEAQISLTVSDAIDKKFQEEIAKIRLLVDDELKRLENKVDVEITETKGGIFFLQANNLIKDNERAAAAASYAHSANLGFKGKDESNGQRALHEFVALLPNIYSEDFEEHSELDSSIERLLNTLQTLNINNRFSDDIDEINKWIKIAKKKSRSQSTTSIG